MKEKYERHKKTAKTLIMRSVAAKVSVLLAVSLLAVGVATPVYGGETSGKTVTTNIYHRHIGNASASGGCYNVPVPHVHQGDNINGGACYAQPVWHEHKGSASTGGGCFTIEVKHNHIGDSTNGGACYEPVRHGAHTDACYESGRCTQTYTKGAVVETYEDTCPRHQKTAYEKAEGIASHSACELGEEKIYLQYCVQCGFMPYTWHDYTQKICGREENDVVGYNLSCVKQVERYESSCGYQQGSVESYQLTCNKANDGYAIGCGLREDQPCGRLVVSYEPLENGTKAALKVRVEDLSGGKLVLSADPYVWRDQNGNVLGTGDSLTVEENGNYSVEVFLENKDVDESGLHSSIQVEGISKVKPTAIPTATPTTAPAATPAATPATAPTATPTATPTAMPVATPTATPATMPTATPIAKPTATPTATPAIKPAVTPTATPAATPTAMPTAKPTAAPTAKPTVTPAATPTVKPAATPTATPMATPTMPPATTPTATPIVTPAPTGTPAVKPSASPTVLPSAVPDATPETNASPVPSGAPAEGGNGEGEYDNIDKDKDHASQPGAGEEPPEENGASGGGTSGEEEGASGNGEANGTNSGAGSTPSNGNDSNFRDEALNGNEGENRTGGDGANGSKSGVHSDGSRQGSVTGSGNVGIAIKDSQIQGILDGDGEKADASESEERHPVMKETHSVQAQESAASQNISYHVEKKGIFWKISTLFQHPAVRVITITLGTLFLLAGGFFILLYLRRSVKVYNDDGEGRMVYLGRYLVNREENGYVLRITEAMEEESYTNRYSVKPGLFLLGKKEGEELIIWKGEDRVSAALCKEMIVVI